MKEALNSIHSVLVTGGTGTFGHAFVPLLLKCRDIDRVAIYSRGEHAQAAMRAKLEDDPRLRWFIGDVRDVDRLTRACRGVDTIVHAAALKRIETGQYNPDEVVKTNVNGTMNVIDAANANSCRRMVLISSDKAFSPISPYGQSKALAESLCVAANGMSGFNGCKFAVARYGNIWNAQGSIVPKFKSMIEAGATTLAITSVDCTRFFMTADEAVDLVWRLLTTMQGGEMRIPDWLPAYRVGDLLNAIAMSYPDRRLEYHQVGLPPWEKLHESMSETLCSATARRMSVDELKGLWNETL